MQTLDYPTFLKRARKAIDEKRLAIQHPDELLNFVSNYRSDSSQNFTACMNLYPPEHFGGNQCHCIIGSALVTTGLDPDDYGNSVGHLIRENDLRVEDFNTIAVFVDLQTRHDRIITSNIWQYIPFDREKFQTEVENFLGLIKKLPDNVEDAVRELGVDVDKVMENF